MSPVAVFESRKALWTPEPGSSKAVETPFE